VSRSSASLIFMPKRQRVSPVSQKRFDDLSGAGYGKGRYGKGRLNSIRAAEREQELQAAKQLTRLGAGICARLKALEDNFAIGDEGEYSFGLAYQSRLAISDLRLVVDALFSDWRFLAKSDTWTAYNAIVKVARWVELGYSGLPWPFERWLNDVMAEYLGDDVARVALAEILRRVSTNAKSRTRKALDDGIDWESSVEQHKRSINEFDVIENILNGIDARFTLKERKHHKGRRNISPEPAPRPGRPSTLPEELKEQILEAVKCDPKPNFSRIAREYHVSNMTVTRLARAEGISGQGARGVTISDEKRTEVEARLPLRQSFRAVAAEVGLSDKTVAKIAMEHQKAERLSRRPPKSRHLAAG
jgi:transposase-like protein